MTPRAPMLVQRGVLNDRVETAERALVLAFECGYATEEHYDLLASMQGVMILAGCTSERRAPAAYYARDTLGPVLAALRTRYTEHGRFDPTADELGVLRGFVSLYRDFWLRQPTELYEVACAELARHQGLKAGGS